MKKRKCHMTAEEIQQHDVAIKIRKMTDKQLCEFVDSLSSPISGQSGVKNFIEHLDNMSGTGNGIGKSTVYKLKEIAEKDGYFNI